MCMGLEREKLVWRVVGSFGDRCFCLRHVNDSDDYKYCEECQALLLLLKKSPSARLRL